MVINKTGIYVHIPKQHVLISKQQHDGGYIGRVGLLVG